MLPLFHSEVETQKGIVLKGNKYSNPVLGPTEPQRKIIKALSSGKGNYLIEVENVKGRKRFRCFDPDKNIVAASFSKVVVRNLEKKGYLIRFQTKFYLK